MEIRGTMFINVRQDSKTKLKLKKQYHEIELENMKEQRRKTIEIRSREELKLQL